MKKLIFLFLSLCLLLVFVACGEAPSVTGAALNEEGDLIITFSDGTTQNAGKLPSGGDGNNDEKKAPTVSGASVNEDGNLIITFTDGTTQNLGKVTGTGNQEDGENPQGLSFLALPDGTYAVSAGNAALLAEIEIPATYRGKAVTKIAEEAFTECENLSSVTIPASVTTIGDHAFSYCDNLSSITIPASVTAIGNSTFSGCTNLSSVSLPSALTSIGRSTFSDCTNLSSVTIPASVTTIDKYAFEDCLSLSSITLPSALTSLGDLAFSDCSNLSSVALSAGTATFNAMAFDGCGNLASITVASGNTSYEAKGNCLIEIASKTLLLGCKNSVIPADGSVTAIGDRAFSQCENLTSVTIPAPIISIGEYVFSNCFSLTEINLNATALEDATKSFAYVGNEQSGVTINIGAGVTALPADIFYTEFYFPLYVTEIVFAANSQITSLPKGLFQYCDRLRSLTLPFIGSSKSDTQNAFLGYLFGADSVIDAYDFIPSSLETVVIMGGTTLIEGAFDGCSYVKSLTLPSTLTTIQQYALTGCPSLTSIAVASGNTSYEAKGNCLIEIASKTLVRGTNASVIPTDGSVTVIGDGAFWSCHGLQSLTIPSGVISISEKAFLGCSFTSIIIPSSVTFIGNNIFEEGSVSTVYYTGTEEEWNTIEGKNNIPYDATVIYNHTEA